jgi:uncharacterized protein (DUF1499 family)
MVRRLVLEEPPSRLATWARLFAFFAIAVALFALILVRGGFVESIPGFVVLAAGLGLAVIAVLLACAAFVVIWFQGPPGFGRALLAFFLGLALIAYPAYLGVRGFRLPALSDITTDTADPPRFEAIARLRARLRDANSVNYAGAAAAQLQRAAYPDIVPLDVNVSPGDAYDAALEVMTARKWLIIEAREPQAGRRDGRIEAVARTPVMGFRDDVVVRVRRLANGSRIDIRSSSRFGSRDLGANAQRIRALISDIEENVSSQPSSQ